GIAVATIVYVLFPEQAFTLMISLSMFGAMATWLLIFVTHWFFRKRMASEGRTLSFTIPFFPVGTILGGVLMVAILVTTLWVE
ncbi:amino acid permease, partial [Klebsiella pneumoniae]|nr:amino acid permease [Klebsiella pneumoniae]